ncbi:MAG: hypothetical protein FWD62_12480 [Betaproteobacteria bacterium]|nr:hypothetical protein [Betaproteobacteria bacterium]
MKTTGLAIALACALSACGGGGGGDGGVSPASASIAACYTAAKDVSFASEDEEGVSKTSITHDTFDGQAATLQTTYISFTSPTGQITNRSETTYWNVTASGVMNLGWVTVTEAVDNTRTVDINGVPTPLTYTYTGISTPDPAPVIPLNMQPGQSIDQQYTLHGVINTVTNNGLDSPGQETQLSYANHYTFVGFETVTLAGKTFSNVCHFKIQTLTLDGTEQPATNYDEEWAAPGYGPIKASYRDAAGNDHIVMQYAGNL